MATEADVGRIALSLPEVIEKPWFNSPGFRVKDKGFLRIRSEAERWLVVFVADLGDKEALLASDPVKFHTTPHYDGYPIVLVDLAAVDEAELTELICDAWRAKAPQRVLRPTKGTCPSRGAWPWRSRTGRRRRREWSPSVRRTGRSPGRPPRLRSTPTARTR